jgi:Organic solute transporter Ostalpha
MLAILRVHRKLKSQLAGMSVMAKLLVLKGIVGVIVLQRLIFSILTRTNTLKASRHVAQADLEIGVPNLLICCEAFLFSLMFLITYRTSPYTAKNVGAAYSNKWSFGAALFHVWNLVDVLGGCLDVFKMRSGQDSAPSYEAPIQQPAPVYEQSMKYEGRGEEYGRRQHHHHHDRHDRRSRDY